MTPLRKSSGTVFQRGRQLNKYNPLCRALDILQLLARERDGLPLTTISQEAKLAKSASHRLLSTLVEEGYVRQDSASERYHLTLRMAALGFRFLAAHGLTDVVQPILDRLAQQTGELVQLGLVEDDRLIWVAWAQGSQAPLRYVPVFGREVVLHTTGSGAAWLASLPENRALEIFRKVGFRKSSTPGYGRNAVRTEKELLARIRKVRRLGFGLNLEAGEPGINAIAVAFHANVKPQSLVAGTIAIAGPSVRVNKSDLIAALPALRAAAREMAEVWPMKIQLEAIQSHAAGSKIKSKTAGRRSQQAVRE